jgi:thiamine biosynthesis lipoprotein ApbE/Na+-translocating ferredoxin:NAD+ oxidoreductase RnfG subunit
VAIAWTVHHQAAWREAQKLPQVSLEQARILFPKCVSLGLRDVAKGGQQVFDGDGNSPGSVQLTLPETRSVRGYCGPNQILIALHPDGRLKGWHLIESADTQEHVALALADEKFRHAFIGWKPGSPAPTIDAVSGATLTSAAIAQSIQHRLAHGAPSFLFPEEVALTEARELFPQVDRLIHDVAHDRLAGYDSSGRLLGFLVRTGSDSVSGYQGPTEVLAALSPDARTVHGIALRRSHDTPYYVQRVREESEYLDFFKGRMVSEIAGMDWQKAGVEGVSGATMTSYSVAEGLKQRFARAPAERRTARWSWPDAGLGMVIIGACVMAFTSLRGRRWVRLAWQAIVVGYVGIATGSLLSLGLLGGWMEHGIPWRMAPGLVLLAAAAGVIPWTTRRQIYCHQLCPHGMVQQWLGGISKRRWTLPAACSRFLEKLPAGLLAVAFTSLLFGWGWPLNSFEAFDAWVWRAFAVVPIAIAVAGWILSIFIPQAYCRFGCPTGALLKIVRSAGSNDRWSVRDWGLLAAVFTSLATVAMSLRGSIISEPSSLFGGRTMGTTWTVKLRGKAPADLPGGVQIELDRIESLLSTWRKDSAISVFNAYSDTQPHPVPEQIRELTKRAAAISAQSEGAFDITIGPLVKAWSFGPPPRQDQPPSAAEIVGLLNSTGWQQIEIGPDTLRKKNPATEIDLSALAEGWALDCVARQLDSLGLDYLIEIGGELKTKGRWMVGIEQSPGAYALESSALATSGTYRQNRSINGAKVSHLIDPRTGRHVTHGTISVSVRHADGWAADAWATALAVLGAEAGVPLAERLGLAALFIDEADTGEKTQRITTTWPSR